MPSQRNSHTGLSLSLWPPSLSPSSTRPWVRVPFPKVSKHFNITGSLWNYIYPCSISSRWGPDTSDFKRSKQPRSTPSSLHLLPFRNMCPWSARLLSQNHQPRLAQTPARAVAMARLHSKSVTRPPCQARVLVTQSSSVSTSLSLLCPVTRVRAS